MHECVYILSNISFNHSLKKSQLETKRVGRNLREIITRRSPLTKKLIHVMLGNVLFFSGTDDDGAI